MRNVYIAESNICKDKSIQRIVEKSMVEKIEYYKADVEASLRDPLMSIARARHLEVRTLVSQVLRRFVSARQELLEGLAKNNDVNEGTQ